MQTSFPQEETFGWSEQGKTSESYVTSWNSIPERQNKGKENGKAQHLELWRQKQKHFGRLRVNWFQQEVPLLTPAGVGEGGIIAVPRFTRTVSVPFAGLAKSVTVTST